MTVYWKPPKRPSEETQAESYHRVRQEIQEDKDERDPPHWMIMVIVIAMGYVVVQVIRSAL